MRTVLSLALLGHAAAYSSRPPEPVLTVHLVSHTHDDVGWLKTVDQYFSGSNDTIQHAGVRNILNSVLMSLERDPSRTFTYVEQAFFQRWWRELPAERRDLTRKLVAEGRLEFTNGGWCMHDEAAAHYVDMVDQTSLGHRVLLNEFGPQGVPTTTWQLDPFGHSATQAALLSAEAGMEGLFFGRIDYQDLALRRAERRAEWVWRASPSLGPDAQVFTVLTGSYAGNYGPPSGFNWDVQLNDEPVEDNPKLETYNLPVKVADFIKAAREQASETRGHHILWTMGSDFQYEAAELWYTNLDKIIAGVNAAGAGVAATYSTPARYLAAKRADAPAEGWPLTDGADLFPYADGPHMFWTGYFSSRPALKRQVRVASALLQAVRQAVVLAPASGRPGEAAGAAPLEVLGALTGQEGVEALAALEALEEALGVSQHHDGVSGTARQHVANDYSRRLAAGAAAAATAHAAALRRMGHPGDWAPCIRLNETVCPLTATPPGMDPGMPEKAMGCPPKGEPASIPGKVGSISGGAVGGAGCSPRVGWDDKGSKGGMGDKYGTAFTGAPEAFTGAPEAFTGAPEAFTGAPEAFAGAAESVFRVSAWNAMGQPRTELVILPISAEGATVRDESGAALTAQVHPAGETITSYSRHTHETPRVLAFLAPLPPAGVAVFTVELHTAPAGGAEAAEPAVVTVPPVARLAPAAMPDTAAFTPTLAAAATHPRTPAASPSAFAPPPAATSASPSLSAPAHPPAAPTLPPMASDVILENDLLRLTFSAATNRLSHFENKAAGLSANVSQTFCFYTSHPGGGGGPAGSGLEQRGKGQPSGAYIFRPLPARGKGSGGVSDCEPVAHGDVATITAVIQGKVVQEVRQVFYQRPWGLQAGAGGTQGGVDAASRAGEKRAPEGAGMSREADERRDTGGEGSADTGGEDGAGTGGEDSPDTGGAWLPWLTQVVRLSAGDRHATFEWTLGPIPKLDPFFSPSDPRQNCVSWRATADCDPHGARAPSNDLACHQDVPDSASGFCECGAGRRAVPSGCGHEPIGSCDAACRFFSGKEIVSRFSAPSIASAGELLTDANGREVLARRRDERSAWRGFNQTEAVAGNYYPVTTHAAIRDGTAQLSVLVDRAQGAASIADGEIELMVHRRVLVDDGRGVAEPLDETQTVAPYSRDSRRGGYKTGPGLVVRGTHALTLEPPATAAAVVRPLVDRLYAAPLLAFAWGRSTPQGAAGGEAYTSGDTTSGIAARGGVSAAGATPGGTMASAPAANQPTGASRMAKPAAALLSASPGGALAMALPPNVQLVTLAPRADGTVLLRLSHQFGIGEGTPLSAPVKVDLSTLFRPTALRIRHATEMSLTANQEKASILRSRGRALAWPGADADVPHPWRSVVFNYSVSPIVTLGPMEIKTFVLEV